MSLLNNFEELQDAQNNSIEFFLLEMVDLSPNPNLVKLKDFLTVEYDPYSHDDDFIHTRMTWFDKNLGNNNVFISAGYDNSTYDFIPHAGEFIIFIGTINTGFKKINWNDFEMYVTMFCERYGNVADCLWDRIYHWKENGIIMRQYYHNVKTVYDVELF